MPTSQKMLVVDTKSSLVYKLIREDICAGRLKPGEKLVASKLAEGFGISVIPVREALGQLKAEGFIDIVPHTGIYVTEIRFDHLKKIYPIREMLEGYATRLAVQALKPGDFSRLSKLVQKIDRIIEAKEYSEIVPHNYEFHMIIYRASGNEPLVKMIDELLEQTNRVRAMYGQMPRRALSANQEHRKMVEQPKVMVLQKSPRPTRLAASPGHRHVQMAKQALIFPRREVGPVHLGANQEHRLLLANCPEQPVLRP